MGRGGGKNAAAEIFYGRSPLQPRKKEAELVYEMGFNSLCADLRGVLRLAKVNHVNVSFDSASGLGDLEFLDERGDLLLVGAEPDDQLSSPLAAVRSRLAPFIARTLQEAGREQSLSLDVAINRAEDEAVFRRYDPEEGEALLLWVDLSSGLISGGDISGGEPS